MGRIKVAVTNTGPLIHFCELKEQRLLPLLVQELLTPEEVVQELARTYGQVRSFLRVKTLMGKERDYVKFLMQQFELQLGEAAAMALAMREKVKLFFTDDLTARIAAKRLGLEPHGTLGLLLRAFREKRLSKEEAIRSLYALRQTSLFITSDLIRWAVLEVKKYKIKG